MRRTPSQVNNAALYEAALEGLDIQKRRLEEHIRMVRSLMGGKKTRAAASNSEAAEAPALAGKRGKGKSRRKRNLSPEARERIAEAQRNRWAAFRKDSES